MYSKNTDAAVKMVLPLPFLVEQQRMLNYEVLAGIYAKRRNHKLDEWYDFCDWIKELPYSEIITSVTTNE